MSPSLPILRPGRAHPPKWYRWRRQLATGDITPAIIAARLGWSLEDTLAWLYPRNPEARAHRNEVKP